MFGEISQNFDAVGDESESAQGQSWRQGAVDFNARRYWHAHEAWEQGWTQLAPPVRRHIQALIQSAAVFHLLERGRSNPARRLSVRALELYRLSAAALAERSQLPRIAGIEELLKHIADCSSLESQRDSILKQAAGLKAVLH